VVDIQCAAVSNPENVKAKDGSHLLPEAIERESTGRESAMTVYECGSGMKRMEGRRKRKEEKKKKVVLGLYGCLD
jgi:hypothetical protein